MTLTGQFGNLEHGQQYATIVTGSIRNNIIANVATIICSSIFELEVWYNNTFTELVQLDNTRHPVYNENYAGGAVVAQLE